MPIFQKSVIQKHLANLEQSQLDDAFKIFKDNYSVDKIQQIKLLKEEEYQDGFLRDIFVDVFGYTLKPDEHFNLVREFKNKTDGKKADGAILKDGNAIAVIELKSTKTKYLKSITQQAFNYKNNQPYCKYVITSNFQKLRFYIDYANEYEEFDLFNLDREAFSLLYLILNKDNLLNGLALQLKDETLCHEENISVQFYKDYSKFKQDIFANLTKNSSQFDQLLLFKKSQKFLDRLLFIFFAEDTGLVPPNSIANQIEHWEKLRELDAYDCLYNRLKKFFQYLNIGYKSSIYDIQAYNGGLFASDNILDSLIIDDEVLKDNMLKLAAYDFNTELDVNILGHIFEHSLNKLKERKKDGIFYTPKYITQYIVENTLGTLCVEKRQELKLIDIEFDESYRKKDGSLSVKGNKLFKVLEAYKKWLFTLKILDPACGSGAFLNQALNFLIAEHQDIDNIIADLTNAMPKFYDTDKMILEKNIFGVDINEESVDIAQLSLWLRTAKKGRKLSNLSQNIKCGNSLIDFDWNKEFPKIMGNGGFDVVIGNPPYIRLQGLKANYEKESCFYENKYKSATANYDIYVLFIEKAFQLISKKGNVCFIQPHKFLISEFGKGLREFLVENKAVESILHFGSNMVFKDASTYTCILKLSHDNKEIKFQHISPEKIDLPINYEKVSYNTLSGEKWNLFGSDIAKVLTKLKQQPLTIKDVFAKIFVGLQTSSDNVYLIKGTKNGNYIKGYSKALDKFVEIEIGLVKPMLKGEDISKYKDLKNEYFVIFPYLLKEGKASSMTEDYIKQNFPKGYQYLKDNETVLRGREHGKMDKEGWFLYIYPKSLIDFEQNKIITPEISFGTNMTLDKGILYHNTKCYSFIKREEIKEDYKFWLSIFNSKVMWFFIRNTGYELRGGYFTFKTKYLEPFPLPKLENINDQQPFIEKADLMLSLNKKLQEKKTKFINRITSNLEIAKISKKLDTFYNFDFKSFVAELKKQKVKLSLVQQDEWDEYFTAYQTEINQLQAQIDKTDNEIDKMVYKLYGLTEEEIGIVETNIT
jgi:type I restriction-modification system DNA methylase subunit